MHVLNVMLKAMDQVIYDQSELPHLISCYSPTLVSNEPTHMPTYTHTHTHTDQRGSQLTSRHTQDADDTDDLDIDTVMGADDGPLYMVVIDGALNLPERMFCADLRNA